MEVQALPALCHFLYRNTAGNFPAKAISFHWHNVKRNLCQGGEISI